jgi:hypothetical protein
VIQNLIKYLLKLKRDFSTAITILLVKIKSWVPYCIFPKPQALIQNVINSSSFTMRIFLPVGRWTGFGNTGPMLEVSNAISSNNIISKSDKSLSSGNNHSNGLNRYCLNY